jgi:hypothetical protein
MVKQRALTVDDSLVSGKGLSRFRSIRHNVQENRHSLGNIETSEPAASWFRAPTWSNNRATNAQRECADSD